MNLNTFADTCQIHARDTDSASLLRAVELDADGNESMMLDSIAMMFDALRRGDDKNALMLARVALGEFDELRNLPEFEQDPVRELMSMALKPVVNMMAIQAAMD